MLEMKIGKIEFKFLSTWNGQQHRPMFENMYLSIHSISTVKNVILLPTIGFVYSHGKAHKIPRIKWKGVSIDILRGINEYVCVHCTVLFLIRYFVHRISWAIWNISLSTWMHEKCTESDNNEFRYTFLTENNNLSFLWKDWLFFYWPIISLQVNLISVTRCINKIQENDEFYRDDQMCETFKSSWINS